VFLRGTGGELVTIREISAATGIPKPYLGKILHYLRRAGLLRAKRGYRGGFALAREPGEISVFDVILAVEGESWRVGCLLYPDSPGAHAGCSIRGLWGDLRALIEEKLRTVTLDGLPPSPLPGKLSR